METQETNDVQGITAADVQKAKDDLASLEQQFLIEESIGKTVLQALVQEVQQLPDVWQKLPEDKQNDVIDRLRKRVDDNIKLAVRLIAIDGRMAVPGELEQITIKDGVKAVVRFGVAAPNLHELYEATGDVVQVVITNNASQYTAGMDKIKGEADQRAMDLGHEYHDNDGGGMDEEQEQE